MSGSPTPNTDPLDYSVVPDVVRRGASKADDMIRQLQEGKSPYASQTAQDGRQEAPSPDQNQDTPKGQDGRQQPAQQAEDGRPTNPGPDRPSQQREQPKSASKDGENWEQKYKSLEGRHTATLRTIEQLTADNTALRNTIAILESTGRPVVKASNDGGQQANAAAQAAYDDLTEEQKQEYGEEFFDVVKRTVGPLLAQQAQEIAVLKEQIGGVQRTNAKTAEQKLHESLDTQVPGWKEINVDPAFIEWLAVGDRYTGQPKSDLLLKAYERGDASRVAAFFTDFLSENGREGELPQAPHAAREAPRQGSSSRAGNSLARLAAPGKSKGTDTPRQAADATPDQPSFTRAEVTDFYNRKTRGDYRGREEEAARIEREIFDASINNRVH